MPGPKKCLGTKVTKQGATDSSKSRCLSHLINVLNVRFTGFILGLSKSREPVGCTPSFMFVRIQQTILRIYVSTGNPQKYFFSWEGTTCHSNLSLSEPLTSCDPPVVLLPLGSQGLSKASGRGAPTPLVCCSDSQLWVILPPGDIWPCQETLSVDLTGGAGWSVEIRDAAKHPAVLTGPITKNHPGRNGRSARLRSLVLLAVALTGLGRVIFLVSAPS